MSAAKVSLSAQAAAIRLIADRGVINAMRRGRALRDSEADLLSDRLSAAADTLELLAPYEAEIRALLRPSPLNVMREEP